MYFSAADIFSFGVMLYRMLCGSKPFKGKVDRELDKVLKLYKIYKKKNLLRRPVFKYEISEAIVPKDKPCVTGRCNAASHFSKRNILARFLPSN